MPKRKNATFHDSLPKKKLHAGLPKTTSCTNPLGGPSYYFKTSLIRHILSRTQRCPITIHIGAQPNTTLHLGNVTSFATGFAIAKALLKADSSTNPCVKFVYVETTSACEKKGEVVRDGVIYQHSLQSAGEVGRFRKVFRTVLNLLGSLSGIGFEEDTRRILAKE